LEYIQFSQQGSDIFATVICDEQTPTIDQHKFKKAFSESDFSNTFPVNEEIAELFNNIQSTLEAIQAKESEPTEITHKVAETRDARIKLTISPDKMSASATIEAAWAGKHASMDDIKALCVENGVKFGVKRSKVEKLLMKAMDAEAGQRVSGEVAIGKAPKNGKNAYFKPLVELFADKIRKPTEQEDGSVDLKELGDIETVKPGERIFQKIPLTSGIDGRNVLGQVVEAMPGKDAKLEVSAGTVIDPNDENVLLAKKEGLARLIETRMEVDDVYTLAELSPKHGHVKFNGSVVILGDVLPDMRIVATGDVLVGGYVESASIRCKGEITVLSGVSGKPLDEPEEGRENNCLLESGHRINISFANHVDILAKRDVFVHRQISHCNLSAASLVVGKGEKPRGKVIGGYYFLSKYLEAGHVGAPSDTETKISLNRTYQVFKKKEKHFWNLVEELEEKLAGWEKKLSTLVRDDQKAAVKFEMAQLENIIEKNMSYRKTLIQRRREFMESVFVKVNHTLYGGLAFEFGSKGMVNEVKKGPSVVRLDEYQLVIEPQV
jgi:uncharacterized protein (DUF342 family)